MLGQILGAALRETDQLAEYKDGITLDQPRASEPSGLLNSDNYRNSSSALMGEDKSSEDQINRRTYIKTTGNSAAVAKTLDKSRQEYASTFQGGNVPSGFKPDTMYSLDHNKDTRNYENVSSPGLN